MDVVKMTSFLTLMTILVIAVVQDFKSTRVSNRLILAGLGMAVLFKILGEDTAHFIWILPNIIFPVIILYLFYLMRVLGAGDIKLFSVVGGFYNFKELIVCMIAAMVAGAVFSGIKLLVCGTLKERLMAGYMYLYDLSKGNLYAYDYKKQDNIVHFSYCVLVGALIAKILHIS